MSDWAQADGNVDHVVGAVLRQQRGVDRRADGLLDRQDVVLHAAVELDALLGDVAVVLHVQLDVVLAADLVVASSTACWALVMSLPSAAKTPVRSVSDAEVDGVALDAAAGLDVAGAAAAAATSCPAALVLQPVAAVMSDGGEQCRAGGTLLEVHVGAPLCWSV